LYVSVGLLDPLCFLMSEFPDRNVPDGFDGLVPSRPMPGRNGREFPGAHAGREWAGAGCVDPEWGRLLVAYALGSLPPDGEQEVEAHLLACDPCFDALRGLDQLELLIRHLLPRSNEADRALDRTVG
jgi:hypothetical protein